MKNVRGKAMVPVAKVSGPGEGICGAVLRQIQEGNGSPNCARKFDPWNDDGFSHGTVRGKQRTILLLLQVVEKSQFNHRKGMKLERGELRLVEAGNGYKPGVKCFEEGGAVLFIPNGIPPEKISAYVDKIVKDVILNFYENNNRPVSTATGNERKHSPPPSPRRENRKLRQPLNYVHSRAR